MKARKEGHHASNCSVLAASSPVLPQLEYVTLPVLYHYFLEVLQISNEHSRNEGITHLYTWHFSDAVSLGPKGTYTSKAVNPNAFFDELPLGSV